MAVLKHTAVKDKIWAQCIAKCWTFNDDIPVETYLKHEKRVWKNRWYGFQLMKGYPFLDK